MAALRPDNQLYFTAGGRAGRGGPGGGGINMTNIVDTAYFARSAWILAQSAKILGKPPEDATRFDKLFHDICDAFNKAYVNPEDGTINVGSPQTAYILALEYNLLPENLRPMAAKHLADDVEQRKHLTTGFVGVGYINPALSHIGRSDLAYDLLFQDTYPSWLYTIRQGATTMWERWDGYTPETGFQASSMNSFNHYSFGSVGRWLYSGVGGIEQDEAHPGYKAFGLVPQVSSKLNFAKTTMETPYGMIVSAWHRDGEQFVYEATVPANSTATLTLPAAGADLKTTGEAPVDMKVSGTSTVMSLPAGKYAFSFPASGVK
jgi:alpha-L-rhamnosidase